MSAPLQYNESMGSFESHQDVMRNRVINAKDEFERVSAKPGVSQIAIENAKSEWELRQREYEEFKAGGSQDSSSTMAETIQ